VIYASSTGGSDIFTDRQIVAERCRQCRIVCPPESAPSWHNFFHHGTVLVLAMFRDKTSAKQPDPHDLELRTIADWDVRQRLLTIRECLRSYMGGGRKQFQVLVDPEALLRFGVSLDQVRDAMVNSNQNATGGYLDEQGPNEFLVRALGRIKTISDLQQVVVTVAEGRPVALAQVARVVEAAQVKRGDSVRLVRGSDGP
jgi:Cu/Ag efflux pump CusA